MSVAKHTERRDQASKEWEHALKKLKKACESKNPELIDSAIAATDDYNKMYPATFGRWHVMAREIKQKTLASQVFLKAQAEQQDKVSKGMLPNFNIEPEDVCQAIVDKETHTVRAGLNSFISPNIRDPLTGFCLLHLSILHFKAEIFQLLLKAKADPNLLTSEGQTIWHLTTPQTRGYLQNVVGLTKPAGIEFYEPTLEIFKFQNQNKILYSQDTSNSLLSAELNRCEEVV